MKNTTPESGFTPKCCLEPFLNFQRTLKSNEAIFREACFLGFLDHICCTKTVAQAV